MPIVSKPCKIKHMPDTTIHLSGVTDPDWVRMMLDEHHTMCEFPACPLFATTVFFHERVVAWVCEVHRMICSENPSHYDSALSVALYEQLLVWSYVISDIKSNMGISARAAVQQQRSAMANRNLAKQDISTVQIREIIAKIGSKPGQPESNRD